MTTNLVVPDPDSFRVRPTTPLGQVVGRLRRLNPDAPYPVIKALADDLRHGRRDTPTPEPDPEPVAEPEPVKPRKRPGRRRQPRNEAEASMVPVEGGEDIPAEPPERW